MEKVQVAGANGTTRKQIITILNKSHYFESVAMVRKECQKNQYEKDGIIVLADLEKDVSYSL